MNLNARKGDGEYYASEAGKKGRCGPAERRFKNQTWRFWSSNVEKIALYPKLAFTGLTTEG